MEHLDLRGGFVRAPLQAIFVRRADERLEQRMRLERLRLEFRMELAADEIRMVGDLHHLDVGAIGRGPGNPQAAGDQRAFVFSIELVAMAVALADLGLVVDLVGEGSGFDFAGPCPPSVWSSR